MGNGDQKSLCCLSTQGATTGVCDGAADHDWKLSTQLVKDGFDGKQGSFCVEGIKNGFNQ